LVVFPSSDNGSLRQFTTTLSNSYANGKGTQSNMLRILDAELKLLTRTFFVKAEAMKTKRRSTEVQICRRKEWKMKIT